MKKALVIANMLFALAAVFGMESNNKSTDDWKVIRQQRMVESYGHPQVDVDNMEGEGVVREMVWEKYKNERPTESVLITDASLSFNYYDGYDNSNEWVIVKGGCSFPKLTKLSIHKRVADSLWTDDHVKALSIFLSGSPNLCSLHLCLPGLTELPKEIGNLVNLKVLCIEESRELKKGLKEIGNLVNLKVLCIEESRELKKGLKEIGNLINLERLDLHDDGLEELPPEIGNLVNLKRLDLTVNKLKELPPEIGKLTSLTELHLGQNELEKLPPEIGNLIKLEVLNLYNNDNLKKLPPEIGNLVNLTELNYSLTGGRDEFKKMLTHILEENVTDLIKEYLFIYKNKVGVGEGDIKSRLSLLENSKTFLDRLKDGILRIE